MTKKKNRGCGGGGGGAGGGKIVGRSVNSKPQKIYKVGLIMISAPAYDPKCLLHQLV